ncbi:MAG TPA: hypothetical protein VFT22_24355 [Kofleriaceae bacterium]|nr:hypothetical protein [Kofleriaceae bacterium]
MSRYDLFRRRIAPVAFFLAIALIARDSCDRDKRTHTTVELELGDARPIVRAVDIDVTVGADTVATFRRAALPGQPIGPCRFPVALPGEDGELHIELDLGTRHPRITRRFHAIEDSTMQVVLSDRDLR